MRYAFAPTCMQIPRVRIIILLPRILCCYQYSTHGVMEVLPQARLSPIQRLRCLAALHNESCCRSSECGATAALLPSGAPRAAVTLGRRAAAWVTRSITDCSAFPISSDIATFHIPSNGYDIWRKETCPRWRQPAFKIRVPPEEEVRRGDSALCCSCFSCGLTKVTMSTTDAVCNMKYTYVYYVCDVQVPVPMLLITLKNTIITISLP